MSDKVKPTVEFDVVAKTGSYEKDGKTKNIYENVGVVLKDENGYLSLKINRLIFNPDGTINTWMKLFEAKKDNNNSSEDDA